MRANDAIRARFCQDFHGPAPSHRPIATRHHVQQNDVQIVRADFLAETLQVGFHFIGRRGVRLGEDDDFFPRDAFQSFFQMWMRAVLIRGIPEVDALFIGRAQQISESWHAQFARLIRLPIEPAGAGADRQPRGFDAGVAEPHDIMRVFLNLLAGKNLHHRRKGRGGRSGSCVLDELTSFHDDTYLDNVKLNSRDFFFILWHIFSCGCV